MATTITGVTAAGGKSPGADAAWHVSQRWQEYFGERRANLLRTIAIGAFYVIELLNYYGVNLGPLEIAPTAGQMFHVQVTALAVAWAMLALGTFVCLEGRVFPAGLKYVTTVGDLFFLTIILIAADGPRSALVVGYFLIIALAALRFHLPLVRLATAGALLGYLALLGHARWFASDDAARLVPRYQQLIVLVALALMGIVLGQVIRQSRKLAEDYARRASC